MEIKMKKVKFGIAVIAAGLLAAVQPASAHHSFAMFDQNKTVEFKAATVVQFQWSNPHVYVVIKSGNTNYTLECSSPSGMRDNGWKFDTLKAGDKVDVAFFPMRDGRPGGALKTVTLLGGKVLKAW